MILENIFENSLPTVFHQCKTADSNKKMDLMLKKFEEGRKDPFYYEAKPYGKIIFVTLSPIIKNGEFVGCVQTVRLKNTVFIQVLDPINSNFREAD